MDDRPTSTIYTWMNFLVMYSLASNSYYSIFSLYQKIYLKNVVNAIPIYFLCLIIDSMLKVIPLL